MYLLQAIQLISLDLDNTLWEIGSVIQRAESVLWQWLVQHTPELTERFSQQDLMTMRKEIVLAFPDRSHDFPFMRRQVLARAMKACGYPESMVETAYNIFDEQRNIVELYPDILPALGALSERYMLAALTNGSANLQAIGIDHYFKYAINAVDAGAAKPDARIFEHLLATTGIAAKAVLHVGDDPLADVAGARNAGMRTAWINRIAADWPDTVESADIEVSTLSQLQHFLQQS